MKRKKESNQPIIKKDKKYSKTNEIICYDKVGQLRYYECGLKNSYDHIISPVDDFFDQWDSSTLMEEVCRLQRELC